MSRTNRKERSVLVISALLGAAVLGSTFTEGRTASPPIWTVGGREGDTLLLEDGSGVGRVIVLDDKDLPVELLALQAAPEGAHIQDGRVDPSARRQRERAVRRLQLKLLARGAARDGQ